MFKVCKKFLQEKTLHARTSYNKQRNYGVNLLCRIPKNTFFSNKFINSVTKNRKFWKLSNHFFQRKEKEAVKLVENNRIANNDHKMANMFITILLKI